MTSHGWVPSQMQPSVALARPAMRGGPVISALHLKTSAPVSPLGSPSLNRKMNGG